MICRYLKSAVKDSILANIYITISSENDMHKNLILSSLINAVIKLARTIKELPNDKLHKKASLVKKYVEDDPNRRKTP